jgi:hypothetical protein
MYEVLVNDEPQPRETPCETWGKLLAALDARCTARGQVVTAVRFDGVEQPAFRGGEFEAIDLSGLATIEVEAATPAELLLSTIEQAVAAIDALQQAADRIGASFRGFDVSSANEELASLASGLGSVITVADTLGQAMQIELATLPCEGGTASTMVDELVGHAEALIGAREIGDWITVADIVEYDVAPCLRRWPAVFHALRDAVPAGSFAPVA